MMYRNFLEMISAERSRQTIANYAYDFALFFDFLKEKEVDLESVTPRMLRRFFAISKTAMNASYG